MCLLSFGSQLRYYVRYVITILARIPNNRYDRITFHTVRCEISHTVRCARLPDGAARRPCARQLHRRLPELAQDCTGGSPLYLVGISHAVLRSYLVGISQAVLRLYLFGTSQAVLRLYLSAPRRRFSARIFRHLAAGGSPPAFRMRFSACNSLTPRTQERLHVTTSTTPEACIAITL